MVGCGYWLLETWNLRLGEEMVGSIEVICVNIRVEFLAGNEFYEIV